MTIYSMQRKRLQSESASFVKRNALHLHIERVVGYAVYYNMRADITGINVVGRELMQIAGMRKHTIANSTIANYKRVDLQVERSLLLGSVL